MNLRNNVQLIGNLGADPIVKEVNKTKVANFSIAVNDNYKPKDSKEFVEKTLWFNVVAWDRIAEKIEKKCSKGTEVIINGKLENKSYTDKEGVKRIVTEVRVDEIICRVKAA
ncbi:MAG: single-stranded DNA-binding protein [Bacteroidales bacterium]|nr:single-stranded DNA-binding protein [Bacteroidales bacterium]